MQADALGKGDSGAMTDWYSVRVHGHSGQLQSSQGWLVERTGFYLRMKAIEPTEAWIHYAPSLPVPLPPWPDRRLAGVSIEFQTGGSAHIAGISVWDGARPLAHEDSYQVRSTTGSLAEGGFGELRVDLDATVTSALGISVLVAAPEVSPQADPSTTIIVSVGAVIGD